MFFTPLDPALLGSLILVALSIYTIVVCLRDQPDVTGDLDHFYFSGLSRRYSFASAVGSLFSLTYFFGATFLYSSLFKGAMLIVTLVTLAILAFILPRILTASVNLPNGRQKNMLLDVLKNHFGDENFKKLLEIYVVIYFGLFVEELAVSRLVLSEVFETHPLASVLMLLSICFLITVYLRYGGFRAVLISDYQQLKILVPFALALIFLAFRDTGTSDLGRILTLPHDVNWLGAVSASLFGVAWFASSVDFFARLRFGTNRGRIIWAGRDFIYATLAGLALLLLLGIIFGGHLSGKLEGGPRTPSAYTDLTVSYFTQEGTIITASIFYAALFCMIFTTLDALLLTLQQLGRYSSWPILKRENITTLLLAGILGSVLIPYDSVSVIGIFIGSLFTLPFLAVIQSIFLGTSKWQPTGASYLQSALVLSIIAFGFSFERLRLDFSNHFLLALVTILVGLACFVIAGAYRALKSVWSD